jgi:glycosyltransferase involved in cell wall biosynthesis
VRSKGIIEAVSALRDTGVGLDVVGEGPDASSMEKQAADLGVEARFHGAVDGSAVAAHMRRARLLLHPSHTEGLPTVVLEAAALGLPVVATDVGGTREIVSGTDDGWLVPARDQARLDAAVREALAAPELAATRGATARAGVGEHFSWDAVIDAITEGVVPRA